MTHVLQQIDSSYIFLLQGKREAFPQLHYVTYHVRVQMSRGKKVVRWKQALILLPIPSYRARL